MAPNVTVSFWAPGDINGTPLKTFTDEDEAFKGFKWNPDLYALGGWELRLARAAALGLFNNGMAQPEVFVRFLIHVYSDTIYYGGGVLNKRRQTLIQIGEDGAEEFVFGGPGPKAYLERFKLGIENNAGSGLNLDLEGGVWRWAEDAPAGKILSRIIAEDLAADDPALLGLSKTFDKDEDSAGNPWTEDIAGPDSYEVPIGTSLLNAMWELEDLSELYTVVDLGTVDNPAYILNAYQSYGDDVTSTSFAADKVLLKEGVNIANDSLEVEGVSLRAATHVIVEGANGSWAVAVKPSWSPGDYVKWEKIEHPRSGNATILEKAGIRWLQRQDNGDQEITVEILPGADDTAGLYFPTPDGPLWLGNTITLDSSADGTSHTPLDFQNEDELVTGFELVLGPAGDTASALKMARSWEVKVKLNIERGGHPQSPNQGTSSGSNNPGGGKCDCGLRLCKPAVPGSEEVEEETTLLKFFDANDAGSDAINWTGILANQGGSADGAEGSDYYYFKSTAPEEWQDVIAASAGTVYRISGYFTADDPAETLKFGFFNSSMSVGSPANNTGLIGTYHVLQQGVKPAWTSFSWDLTAPAGTIGMALGRHGGGVAFDRVRISSVDVVGVPAGEDNPGDCPEDVALECSPGTGGSAARCDHVHAHGNLSEDGDFLHDVSQIIGVTGEAWETVVGDLANKVHRWQMEESSGYPQDSIGSLHMTTGTVNTRSISSPIGNAIEATTLNGSGNGSAPTGANPRTFVWVCRSTSVTDSSHIPVLEYGPTGSTRQWCHLCINHDGFAQAGILFWSDDHKPAHFMGDNVWHLMIARYRARAVDLTIDGLHVYQGTTGAALSTTNSGNLKLFGAVASQIADAIILSRWITNEEVRRLSASFANLV